MAKSNAAERTVPMFPKLEEKERQIVDAAVAWFLNKPGSSAEAVLTAVRRYLTLTE